MDCSLPSSSLHGILQARALEWVAISFSRGSSLTQGLNPGLPNNFCVSSLFLHFYFLCSLGQSTVFYFCWTVLTLLMGVYIYIYIYTYIYICVCVCVCVFHCFNYYLPDFVTAICVGFIIFVYFSFLYICFKLT